MENLFELEQKTHLVLAQYYRWYQVYEIPFTDNTIRNHKDILSDEVEIVSQNAITNGKDGLEDRLRVFTGWQNAHHVQHTEVNVLADGRFSLEADILYQNIRPDNSKYCYTLHYSTILQQRINYLPVFTKLVLQPTSVVEEFNFEKAYTINRAKSFMHYWLYLMERPDIEFFKELLDQNFELHLSSGITITDIETFENWILSNASKLKTSTHQYKNLEVLDYQGVIVVKVTFDWKGITLNDEKMIAKTQHEWILSNNTEQRFAKMKKMNVELLVPFQIVDEF